MEGLESLPAIASSARAIAEGLPLAVGPSAIGLRMNPYGAAPMENPQNIRQAMNRNDPRQRGLAGAAWTIGYYAHFARFGFAAVAFGGTTGPFGLVHAPQSWPQPWYEANGGTFPVFHAIRLLSAASGQPLRALDVSNPSAVQGICVDAGAGRELVLANLTPNPQQIRLPAAAAGALVLDADRFVDAAADPQFTDKVPAVAARSDLVLGPYALARIRLA
jgi:hypothetical protein